jgi:protein SCO1/2
MYLERYRRAGAREGWHFLVGEKSSISALAESVGFSYAYDEATDQYAHGSAIMVLTPDGKLAKYLYGIDYSPIDLRLALVEAASGQIGSLTDAVLLTCFQYDPLEGTYSFAIMQVVRVVGGVTVVAILGFIFINIAREKRRRARSGAGGGARSAA